MRRTRIAILFMTALLSLLLQACASVKAYEREHLAKRIMDFNKATSEEATERHWLETLEGSTGGMGGSGGGCACN